MIVGGVERWIPTVVVAIAAIPVGLLCARALESARVGRGVPPAEARRTAWTEVFMLVTTVPWLWMILTPIPRPSRVQLYPWVDLADLATGRPDVAVAQIGGNLLVFAGFGFLARIRWSIRPAVVVLIAAVASATVEALQYVLDLGRVASIDDVIVNAAGAGLAALCARPWAAHGFRTGPRSP